MNPTETDPTGSNSRCRRQLLQSVVGLGVGSLVAPVTVTSGEESQLNENPLQWRFETGGRVQSSPTVVDGTVYVGSNDNSLYALDAIDGTKRWELDTEEEGESSPTGHAIEASPAVVDDLVVVGNYAGTVFGLNADDGSTRWEFETGSTVRSSATIVDETVYLASGGNVYALDATDGSELWSSTGGGGTSSPTVVEGAVFIGGGRLVALDATEGTLLWSFGEDEPFNNSPTVANGMVFVGDSKHQMELRDNFYALDAATGELEWKHMTTSKLRSSPTVADGTVYIGDHNAFFALDSADGSERWVSYEAPAIGESSPTVADGSVYVGAGGELCALNTSDGSDECVYEIEYSFRSSPTIVAGTAYIAGSEGQVFAIDVPAAGSSYDSRVRLGTLGHHDDWQGQMRSLDFDPGRDDELQIDWGTYRPDDSENGEENATDEGDDTDGDDDAGDGMPGLGVGSSLAALGGAGYLLRRRLGGDDATE